MSTMITFPCDKELSLVEAAQLLGLPEASLDTDFGVVPLDANSYCVRCMDDYLKPKIGQVFPDIKMDLFNS